MNEAPASCSRRIETICVSVKRDFRMRASFRPIGRGNPRYQLTRITGATSHGVPLEVVSKRLGHATIGITAERYLHVYRERDAEAAEVFEQLAS
ncbi:hypothetical protein WPS_30590 [Vulcanimicrobium alpinum]|uniref:Tyr recombinase domain-containing protein n=1 Tax=Vulcanimicrobium alpinum TaxID=3016050 RepID=A0AAN2CBA5_UNVUL|nr:hypothetical protein [Vulcanimicrobium alpinum]BDE07783.1 hypothetical protein WPS_30590 [Vulcanimicrobium alpinum]